MPHRNAFLASCILAGWANVGHAASPISFEKGASQFCVSNLSAAGQRQYYSRMLNLGASYSHGCTECDVRPWFSKAMRATNDEGWIRRNLLVQFLQRAPWANPSEWAHEWVAVAENDPVSNFATLFPKKTLKKTPYHGRWLYSPENDTLKVADAALSETLARHPLDAAPLVGAGRPRTDWTPPMKDSRFHGQVFQTIPGRYRADGATTKTIFDFATDGSMSYELFKFQGDERLYKDLMANGWKDAAKRRRLVDATVKRLMSTSPSIVFAVDFMAWDAFFHMFHLISKSHPSNPIVAVATNDALHRLANRVYHGDEMEGRIRSDVFEVLARVSRGEGHRRPVPVLFTRLIDDPAKTALGKGLYAEFGKIAGGFIKTMLGIEVTAEVTEALRNIDPATLDYREQPKDIVSGIARDILKDLPIMLKAADAAFNFQNNVIREFTARTNNNVHLVNADEFFLNFHQIVHTNAVHPHVKGARWVAGLFDRAVCESPDSE